VRTQILTPELTASANPRMAFGESISISRDFALVGASWDNLIADGELPYEHPTGSAYVFERNATGTWTATTRLLPSDGYWEDQFGGAVAVDGDHLLVGAFEEEDEEPQYWPASIVNKRAVYFFER
jgi:hypothetical protein